MATAKAGHAYGPVLDDILVGVEPVGLDWVDADTVAVALAGEDNLALVDLSWCLLVSPQYPVGYLNRGWPYGAELCTAVAVLNWIFSPLDWNVLALISLFR